VEVVCSGKGGSVVGGGGGCVHASVARRLALAPPASSSASAGAPHGPNQTRHAAMGRVLGGRWLIFTGKATLRLRRRGRPDSLAVSDEVAEAVAMQTTPWQPASHYSMRVEEAVETSIVKLCGDPPG
jgi:hypothetical protein